VNTTETSLVAEANGVDALASTFENGSKRRVLRVWMVDNNAALRVLYAQLLTKQPGIRCTRQFPSAEAVLATLAEERPPDMILLDINLGGQSGLAAIQPIKKLAPSVKVLMLTMFNNSLYEVEAFHSGASGFLLKSYELDEIAKLIHEAHRNPSSPSLFPNIALQKKVQLECEEAGTVHSRRRFNLVGALRRLCSAPRRQAAS
jgi:DNA-binding NarL/FixJ family response regulator